MHKLVEYICDELDELERKADKDGKLSMQEVEYMDTLAHAKKNLLKTDEGYSTARMPYFRDDRSMARRRDAMGRYSRNYSYGDDMRDMADSIREMLPELPEDVKHDAQRLAQKLDKAM